MNLADFVMNLFGIGILVFIALAALALTIMPFVKREFEFEAPDVILVLVGLIVFGIFGIFSYVAITAFISAL